MEPIHIDPLAPKNESSSPVDVNKTGAFVLPKQESNPTQHPITEAPKTVDVNATLPNQMTEVHPVSQQATPVVENAPVRQPNITDQSDHPLPAGTSFAELQAKLDASKAQTQQVLLPQQPTTETPKPGWGEKVRGWLKFGKQ